MTRDVSKEIYISKNCRQLPITALTEKTVSDSMDHDDDDDEGVDVVGGLLDPGVDWLGDWMVGTNNNINIINSVIHRRHGWFTPQ